MADETLDPRPTHGGLASRRIVFTGLASLGVAAALAGCGSSGSSGSSGSGSGGSGSTAKAGKVLVKTADVPVDGGVILPDENVVITQPTKGTFKAFSATCTHQGFTVSSVAANIITCNRHGSQYSAVNGSVKRGPAPTALAAVAIKVSGDAILAA